MSERDHRVRHFIRNSIAVAETGIGVSICSSSIIFGLVTRVNPESVRMLIEKSHDTPNILGTIFKTAIDVGFSPQVALNALIISSTFLVIDGIRRLSRIQEQ